MRDLMLPPRRCSDCGDETIMMVTTTDGRRYCSPCWSATTATADTPSPPAPSIERWIRIVERREAAR